MEKKEAMLLEFAARKEQVLNLEMRLFLLVFALEALFLLVYVFNADRVRQSKAFSLGSALVYFVLFLEMVAINGKMGVVSMYLRQMETYMTSQGYVGVVWESKALDMIIFPPGNAFTLPAGLTILCLLVQTLYVVYLHVGHFSESLTVRVLVTAGLGFVLLLLIAKTMSVDFHRELPQVFGQKELPATKGE